MPYGFYPGCSLGRTARAYDVSIKAVMPQLGIEFKEIEDWNCCGASEYFSLHKHPAYALVARNLALASQQGGFDEIVAPCSMCYLNLRKTEHYLRQYPELAAKTNEALAAGGLHYDAGQMGVRHLLDVIVRDIGLETIQAKVTRPLTGLRVAPYYGCLYTRPDLDSGAANLEYPTDMDRLMKALGAEVVDFPAKTHCCGGHLTQISGPTAFELIRHILDNAADYQADVIVTICPMCQLNLDGYQAQTNQHFGTHYSLPILYFTQLIGLALGCEAKELGFGGEIVSAGRALAKIGTPVEAPAEPARHKKDDKSLPMPAPRAEA
ncbi:MAG: CoB--CoM heterodisulfide reductase iron-sulfur subunit B family protein [Actinobacteria bacterium]|nr:CoB--CoM heterodisulfide reductase iron-sulfur subunit B family protein [Actinomycetota bacterium]